MKLQAIEITDNSSFNLDQSDLELAGDYMEYKGHKYHPYAPMATFISSLSYLIFYKIIYLTLSNVYYNYYFDALFKSISFSLLEILIFAISGCYFYRILRTELPRRLSLLGVSLLTFASLATAYLPQVNHHTLAVSFIVIALLILGSLPTLIIYFSYNYIVTGNILVTPEQIYDVNVKFLDKFSFYNLPTNLVLWLFSTSKSIFFYHPYLLFLIVFYKDSLYTIKCLLRQSYSKIYMIFSILIVSLYLLWNDCLGDSSYGNRYFITVIPFAIFLLMKVLNRVVITKLRLAFIAASVCSGYLVNQTLSYTNLSMIYNRSSISSFNLPGMYCQGYYFLSFPRQLLPGINLSIIELKQLSSFLTRYSVSAVSIMVFSVIHILNLILMALLLGMSKFDSSYENKS